MLAQRAGMTLRQFLRCVTSQELTEQRVAYRLNPWGPERWSRRFAMLASVIATVHGFDADVDSFDDSVREAEEDEGKSDEQLMALVLRCNARMGGSVK